MKDRLKRLFGRGAESDAVAPDALRVLLVCAGNICRSPTAEGVLRAKIKASGLQGRVLVESAGTHGFHAGDAPDPRAVQAAANRGYDLRALRARPVQDADFQHFHHLLAMDDNNLDWLRRNSPEAAPAQLGLLMSAARQHAGVRVVPDPYYGAPAGFERVLDLVEDACDGWVAQWQSLAPGR